MAKTIKKMEPHGSDLLVRLVDSERVILEAVRENRKLRGLVEEMIEVLRVESVDPERYILELKLLGESFSYEDAASLGNTTRGAAGRLP